MNDMKDRVLPSALETVSVEEIRNASKPSDYTVYTQELMDLMDSNGIKDDFRQEISLAVLWRLADAKNDNLDEVADSFLEKFYTFAKDKNNCEITDKIMESLMTVVLRKAENNNWGLSEMSEEMENFILDYFKGRLVELRMPGNESRHERIAKIISDVVDKQEAQSETNQGSDDVDDMLIGDFGGQYQLSERFVVGLSELLRDEDKSAANEALKKDIKGVEEILE